MANVCDLMEYLFAFPSRYNPLACLQLTPDSRLSTYHTRVSKSTVHYTMSTSAVIAPRSAASRALQIPELVSIVTNFVFTDYQRSEGVSRPARSGGPVTVIILSCMRVNRLWFEVVVDLTWSWCGHDPSHKRPYLRDLLAISSQRRQSYANHIQTLSFDDRVANFDPFLARLRFPRLQHIRTKISGEEPNETRALGNSRVISSSEINGLRDRRLLGPNLRSIRIDDGDSWMFGVRIEMGQAILNLKGPCTGLKSLIIHVDRDLPSPQLNGVSFSSVLKTLPELATLHLGKVTEPILTKSALRTIAEYRKLVDLKLPNFKVEFVQGLNNSSPLFTRLKILELSTADDSVDAILSLLRSQLRILKVTATSSPTQLFNIIGRQSLNNLRELGVTVDPAKDILLAGRLEAFAAGVPNLKVFSLPIDGQNMAAWANVGHGPSSFFDAAVNNIAIHLPLLTSFNLGLNYPRLSENSLISLGKYCPDLEQCFLTAQFSLSNLYHHTSNVTWRELRSLSFGQLPDDDDSVSASWILRMMPKLTDFDSAFPERVAVDFEEERNRSAELKLARKEEEGEDDLFFGAFDDAGSDDFNFAEAPEDEDGVESGSE